jgi:hypothetical protein
LCFVGSALRYLTVITIGLMFPFLIKMKKKECGGFRRAIKQIKSGWCLEGNGRVESNNVGFVCDKANLIRERAPFPVTGEKYLTMNVISKVGGGGGGGSGGASEFGQRPVPEIKRRPQ